MSAWPAHQAHGDVMGACPTNKSLQVNPHNNNTINNNDQNNNNNSRNANGGNGGNTNTTTTSPKLSAAEQEYNNSISRGDQAMTNKNYTAAKAEYQKALSHKPGDKVASDKLKQADDALKASQAPANKEVTPERKETPARLDMHKLNPGGTQKTPNP